MAGKHSEVVGGDIVIRRARFDDYDQVVEMSKDLFDGSDYLATTFYEILHNPDIRSYVAEYRGQVVRRSVYIRHAYLYFKPTSSSFLQTRQYVC